MVHASFAPLAFAGHSFRAHPSGALFWPERSALFVADLHLEKSSFYAGFGQMLPPYDSLATLSSLTRLVEESGAERLWCLGDAFHDSAGEFRLAGEAEAALRDLCRRLDWTWITGNHDAGLLGRCGGRVLRCEQLGALRLTHIASDAAGPELSGHYHPRIHLNGGPRRIARRCYLRSAERLILPAFGAMTAGLPPDHPAILALFGASDYDALVPVEARLLAFPLRQGRVRPAIRATA